MHLSYYTIPVKLEDEENKYLLVHGYTGAIDIVDGSIWKELKDYSSESTLSLEVTQLLQKRGYLTTKSKDEEIEYVSKLANLFHQAQSKLHKSFGFIVSYDCNFRCPYCFENEISQHGVHWSKRAFTKEMVDKAYDAMFQIEPRQELHLKRILLYGGEPFLRENKDIVDYIVQKGNKLGYKFKAITNGYDLEYYTDILTSDYFDFVQITLDGNKEHHNQRRFHYLEGDSFDKIIENIGVLIQNNVDVRVRVNTDENNFHDFLYLKSLFEKLGYNKNSRFQLYSSILRKYDINSSASINYISSINELNEKHSEEYNNMISCQDLGISDSFYRYLKNGGRCKLTSASCSAQYGSFLFDPYGDIYTCLETVGKKEHVIGKYTVQPIQWTIARKYWFEQNTSNMQTCQRCKYSLLCGGACPVHMKYTEKGFVSSYCNNYKSLFPKSINKAYRAYKNNIIIY